MEEILRNSEREDINTEILSIKINHVQKILRTLRQKVQNGINKQIRERFN